MAESILTPPVVRKMRPPRQTNSPISAISGTTVTITVNLRSLNDIDLFSQAVSVAIGTPKRPLPGTAEGFRGKLHEVVPAMSTLTEEDLEKLIGQEDSDESD